jgi:FtsP/CotA-like multicopper oxidase with cupredoxin domain
MKARKLLILIGVFLILAAVPWGVDQARASQQKAKTMGSSATTQMPPMRSITAAQRQAAAARVAAAREAAGYKPGNGPLTAPPPGGTPDYFGIYPNYANSPLPVVDAQIVINDPTGTGATAQALVSGGAISHIIVTSGGSGYTAPTIAINSATGSGAAARATISSGTITAIGVTAGGSGYALTGGLRKFIDGLPGVTAANANNLGQYIPLAIPDTTKYSGSDYYEIQLVDHSEMMHTDLINPTKVRGYAQTNTSDPTVSAPHYLGPLIVAHQGTPVRLLFTNNLPGGSAGDLFIPTDITLMGAGMGPTGGIYQQNRATVHLHGGDTPWISDGTPHQWTVPFGDVAATYQKGDSARDVPDMPPAGQGRLSLFYTNQQSSRFMFYHDHAFGITRLNVYAGEVAGYLLVDPTEESLITNGDLPNLGGPYRYGVPLIIQDKTYVDASTIAAQDPTWNWGITPGTPHTGDQWFPHVYMPNQNPWDLEGVNAMGRWDYALWFWPPYTGLLLHGTLPNPYAGLPGEPPDIPGTPNATLVPETFVDTPVVNGTQYPYLMVEPKPYRFRILNGCNDRMLNLQLYQADPTGYAVTDVTGKWGTEVRMVPADPAHRGGWPAGWPTPDGRAGGFPDPALIGPSMIQIGTEGGLLPAAVTIPNRPVGYDYNRRSVTVLNVLEKALFLGPAERTDIVIDFTGLAGKTIILYNDAPAPVPAFDPRNDYYTGDPDQTSTGGAPMTQPGYGPNTRTILQFRVGNSVTTPTTFNPAAIPAAYAASQEPPIIPESGYNAAYGATYTDTYVRIQDTSVTFTPAGQTTPITMPLQPKAIQELFELDYGRMNATLGVEVPFTNNQNQTTIPYGYMDPPTELIASSNMATPIGSLGDGTQIWKLTHNGVDTHAIHTHLFNMQLINRVGWDGQVKPPDANELGWDETIIMNPLEDIIVAVRAHVPVVPFAVPNSIRKLDVTTPIGSPSRFFNVDPTGNPVTITNQLANFGWEYVWHCHLLGHEENDMMRPMSIAVAPAAPSNLVVRASTARPPVRAAVLTWTDNSANETGFAIQRATDALFTVGLTNFTVGPNITTYTDTAITPNTTYYYKVSSTASIGSAVPGYSTLSANSLPTATVTASPPAAPTGVAATQPGTTVGVPVTVAWTDNSPSTSNPPNYSAETGFTVQRSATGATGPWRNIGSLGPHAGTGSVTYSDRTAARTTTYWYRVLANNNFGSNASAASSPITTR